MRISDWSSDVCSYDLPGTAPAAPGLASPGAPGTALAGAAGEPGIDPFLKYDIARSLFEFVQLLNQTVRNVAYDSRTEEAYLVRLRVGVVPLARRQRSEEHTSELQSLMRTSYAVFCLKKKNKATT